MTCVHSYTTKKDFPPGLPLLPYPVTHLWAQWIFLPYGCDYQVGDQVRLWLENRQTRRVWIRQISPIFFHQGQIFIGSQQLDKDWLDQIAQDNGYFVDDLKNWPQNPLYGGEGQAYLLEVQPINFEDTLKPGLLPWLKNLLIKIRSL